MTIIVQLSVHAVLVWQCDVSVRMRDRICHETNPNRAHSSHVSFKFIRPRKMSSQSSSAPGSRGVKRARAISTKGESASSNKEGPPKKVKKRIKTSSTSGLSLVLTKTSKQSPTIQKSSTDSPTAETVRPTPVATLGLFVCVFKFEVSRFAPLLAQ